MIRAFLCLVAFTLCECAPVSKASNQEPIPTVVLAEPSVIPATPSPGQKITGEAPVPTRAAQIASPAQGTRFSDQDLGISFAYPPGWETLPRAPDDPPGLTLHGPPLGNGPEPIIFAVTIVVNAVEPATLNDLVDQQLAQVPADLRGGIKRQALSVGGEPAQEVIGLPSQAGALETFVIHSSKLYLIILQPYDEANDSLAPYLRQVRLVYDNLVASWMFEK